MRISTKMTFGDRPGVTLFLYYPADNHDTLEMDELLAGDSSACNLLRRMIPGGMRSSAEHSGIEGLILPDLAGICWLLWPQLFTTKLRVMDIEIAGELTQGMCVIDSRPTRKTPNVELVVDADMVSIKAELHKAFHGFGG